MAKEFGVPIITCAQLNRAVETNKENRDPQPSDLRDSGSIEQDADTVIFLYRDEYYKEQGEGTNSESAGNVAEAIIAKNRHGSTGSVKMGWMPQYTKFLPLTDKEPS